MPKIHIDMVTGEVVNMDHILEVEVDDYEIEQWMPNAVDSTRKERLEFSVMAAFLNHRGGF